MNSRHGSIRITFTGDIMAHISQNDACRTTAGYDYGDVFERIQPVFADADYVVGNLETPLAGDVAGHSGQMYSFNTPDEFARDVHDAGFDLVATANNHCLDRGVDGLYRTLDILDQYGLDHVGTARNREERDRPFVRRVQGVPLGFVNYTYGTNAFANHCFLGEDEQFAVNLFQPQETLPGSIHLLNTAEKIAQEVDALYHKPNADYDQLVAPRLHQLETDIEACRKAGAEFVFVVMHSGGQYNPEPDAYTEHLVDVIEAAGADMIIGHHPHVVHKFVQRRIPVAYSLGNFASTPDQSPPSRENPISATSVVLSVELGWDRGRVAVSGVSFTPTRSVVIESGKAIVAPVFDLVQVADDPEWRNTLIKDGRAVINSLLDRPVDTHVEIKKQYSIELN